MALRPGIASGAFARAKYGFMEQRISLITLGVSDLGRARSFYEALGWAGAQQPDDEVCFFQAGGMVFGLWTALVLVLVRLQRAVEVNQGPGPVSGCSFLEFTAPTPAH